MNDHAKALLRLHAPIALVLILFGSLYASTLDSYGMFMWDEAEYATLGRSILLGEGYSINHSPNFIRPPILPFSSMLAMLFLGSTKDSIVKIPILIFSLLLLYLMYWCVKKEFDVTTGLMSAVCLGLYPSFWTLTAYFLSEIPFMLFYTGAVVFFYFGAVKESRYFYHSWAFFGLSLLVRYTALLFLPSVVLFLLMALLPRNRYQLKNILTKDFFISPALGLLVLMPWFIREFLTFGDPLIGIKYSSTQLRGFYIASMSWNFYLASLPDMMSMSLLGLLVLGVAYTIVKKNTLGFYCLIASLVVIGWMTQYSYKENRLITSVLPFFAILSAMGVSQLVLPPLRNRFRNVSYILLVGLFAVVFALNYVSTRKFFQTTIAVGYPVFFDAMTHLKQHTAKSAVLLGPNVAQMYWYSERQSINYPGTVSKFKNRLDRADWVVITNFERSQPKYVKEFIKVLREKDIQEKKLFIFDNRRFLTILVSSDVLKERL